MMTALEYQKAYTRRRSLALLAAILADNFEAAFLLTFRYSGANIAPTVAVSQIRALRAQARRIAGGPVRYIQTATYDLAAENKNPVFRLIVQLPGDVCGELVESWFMGPAEAEDMTPPKLAAFVSGLMEQPPDAWPEHCATWTCSKDLRRPRLYSGACPEDLRPC